MRYGTKEEFEYSKTIPFPNYGIEYSEDQEGLDVSEVINAHDIDNNWKAAIEVLKYINKVGYKGDKLLFNSNNKFIKTDAILTLIKKHNKKPKLDKIESVTKNFIFNNIARSTNDLHNLVASREPINMGDIREAADKSTSGEYSKNVTLADFSTKYMLYLANMSGKDVIGISAVGQKVFLGISQYMNQKIKEYKNGNITEEELVKSNIFFEKTIKILETTTDSEGNKIENKLEYIINHTANVNFSKHPEMFKQFQDLAKKGELTRDRAYKIIIDNGFSKDESVVLSCLISASTDFR